MNNLPKADTMHATNHAVMWHHLTRDDSSTC